MNEGTAPVRVETDPKSDLDAELLSRIKKMESPEYRREAVSYQSEPIVWQSALFYVVAGLVILLVVGLVVGLT
jgi:hypothetical protein